MVYKISCIGCNKIYIGQTGRLLETRVLEHKKNKNLNFSYHNVKHRIEKDHEFYWNHAEILHRETNYYKTILIAMFFIEKHQTQS